MQYCFLEDDVHFSADVITLIKELTEQLQNKARVNVHFEEVSFLRFIYVYSYVQSAYF